MSKSLESLQYTRGSLSVIDQLKLPLELEYISVDTVEDAWNVIRKMQVRGAPLIAIVAALGLAVDVNLKMSGFDSAKSAADYLLTSIQYLRTSRPTAVNLFVATDELSALIQSLIAAEGATVSSICEGYIIAAEKMLADDLATNKAMGDNGARRILELVNRDKVRVLTICNTGSLATAGYGTALGVVRSLHAQGKLEHIYACETRPYNQGARLTAFEIVEDGLPGTLITDSMASALMAVKGVDCVIVGADRVAANGDTANKIGTYQLAITAKYHKVPFFAAVPTTTLDLSIPSGDRIPIEERPADELTSIFGRRIAPEGIAVWNPSFDVTPCALIKGIITEVGVAEASEDSKDGVIDMPSFLKTRVSGRSLEGAAVPAPSPTGFVKMEQSDIALFISSHPQLRTRVGCKAGTDGVADLSIDEVGDGNINFVYIVRGPIGVVVVKQALPFVRCVGESWPLTVDRIGFETAALVQQRALSREFVPEVFYFDAVRALLVMEFVPPPNLILRKTFSEGQRISTFARDTGLFAARTLLGSSALVLSGGDFRLKVSTWSKNTSLCAISEQVIFTDPYYKAQYNKWTTPQLDDFVIGIQSDLKLKLAISALKARFLGCTQALLHGDLHTGSVMASEGSTFVIDPEFAFYGPMGFDIGAFICNMLLAYFAQSARHGDGYAEWLLQQTLSFHSSFTTEFLKLWTEAAAQGKGELYGAGVLVGPSDLDAAQKEYMAELWRDTLGFAGAKMIRRIVGLAHVADLEEIVDADLRSKCEKRALLLARTLVFASQETGDRVTIPSIEVLLQLAREQYAQADIPGCW
eukprot:gene1075-2104_t